MPALLPGLAQRGVRDRTVARLQVPAELQPATDLAVQVEQDLGVVCAQHQRGRREVVRAPAAVHGVGHRRQMVEELGSEPVLPRLGGHPRPRARRTASSVNGSGSAVTCRPAGPAPTCPIRSRRCRRARTRPGRRGRPGRQQVGVPPDGVSSLDAAVLASSAQSRAASRSRRGRSSSPTRVANVCSAGPPVARRRRTASRSESAPGICVAARVTTMSTQPSTRASSVSRRARAAALGGGVLGLEDAGLAGPAGGPPGRPGRSRRAAPGAAAVDVDAAGVLLDGAEQPCLEPGDVAVEAVVRRLAQRDVQPHVVLRDRQPAPNAVMLAGSSTASPWARAAGRCRCGHDLARELRRAPGRPGRRTWRRPAAGACRASGRPWPASPRAAPRRSRRTPSLATGSTILAQVGRVPSTHSDRLQARADVVAAGSVVVGSSHTSASRAASSTAGARPRPTLRSPSAATTWRAVSCASDQFTGPPSPEDSARPSCCSISPSCAGSDPGPNPNGSPPPPPAPPESSSPGGRKPNGNSLTEAPDATMRGWTTLRTDPATPPLVPLGVPVGAAG